jgi:hypothetical protein
MGVLFTDDFVRADGAIGNGWGTAPASCWDILTNRARAHASGAMYQDLGGGTPNDITVEAVIHTSSPYTSGKRLRLYARSSSPFASGYELALVVGAAGTASMSLRPLAAGVGANLITRLNFALSGGVHTVRLSCVGNLILGVLDGVQMVQAVDSSIAGGQYVGVDYNQIDGVFLSSFTASTPLSAALGVYPSRALPGTGPINLVVTGAGAAWTPGDPGDPIFTADLGTITAQRVLTPQMASITWTAPAEPGLVTFADPDTGARAYVVVWAGVNAGDAPQGGLWDLLQSVSDAAADGLQSLSSILSGALQESADTIVNTLGGDPEQAPVQVELEDVLAFLEGLDDVLGDLPEGVEGVAVQLNHADIAVGLALDRIAEWRTVNDYTAQDILTAIQSIDIPEAVDLQPVLDAIQAARDEASTDAGIIKAALVLIELTTLAGIVTTLGGVASTVAAELPGLALDVADVGTSVVSEAADLALDLVDLGADVAQVLADLTESDQGLADAIAALQGDMDSAHVKLDTLLEGGSGGGPTTPIYPGPDGVDLGAPVAVAVSMTIPGPLHGVLVNIATTPQQMLPWAYGSQASYLSLGSLAFRSADGYAEAIQKLTFTHAVLVPTTFPLAGDAVARFHANVSGTVTPWTLKA